MDLLLASIRPNGALLRAHQKTKLKKKKKRKKEKKKEKKQRIMEKVLGASVMEAGSRRRRFSLWAREVLGASF